MIIIKNRPILVTILDEEPTSLSMHPAVSAIKKSSYFNDPNNYTPGTPHTPKRPELWGFVKLGHGHSYLKHPVKKVLTCTGMDSSKKQKNHNQ